MDELLQKRIQASRVSPNLVNYDFAHFGSNRNPVNIKQLMPKHWDHPTELFEVRGANSDSQTINLCDALIRKTDLLYENYRGTRVPDYL